MSSIFFSNGRRQRVERKQAALTAVLATLKDTSTDSDIPMTGEEYLTVFKSKYSGPDISQYDRKLSKGLKYLAEDKRRDEIVRKLEKKSAGLERKLSKRSMSATSKSVGIGGSNLTLVDGIDEEKMEKL
jgi:hypothetical protein